MSDQIPSGKPDQAGGEGQGSKDSVSYDSYAKLLSEKKKLQTEKSEIEAYKNQLEQEKLQAEGKWRESAENYKKLADETKEKNLNLIKNVTEKAIRSQFVREAEKLGCLDPEIAMKAVDFNDLEVTSDFEFDNQKLVHKIQDLTKTKPYLFKKDFKLHPDLNPSNSHIPEKDLSELTDAELKEALKAANRR